VQREPLVSIVIPSYNHASYIGAAIESVVRQTYSNIEFFVIDDGSSDDSPGLIKALSEKYDFTFIAQDNMGLSKTLNKAINLARGEYFVSFGSDDMMLPDRIEKQVAFMEAHPEYPITSGNVIFIDEHGSELTKQSVVEARELDFDDIFLNRKPGLQAAGAMVKKALFDNHGAYDPNIPLEDMYMWFKLLSNGHKAYAIEDKLAYYRKHSTNTYKNIPHMLNALLKTIESYQQHEAYETVKNKVLISHFMASSKQDHIFALSILKQIPLKCYSLKVLRGIKNCLIRYFRSLGKA